MVKKERNKTKHVYVSSFVPEHLMPNKQPNVMDPFLEPLIAELEELFTDGILRLFSFFVSPKFV